MLSHRCEYNDPLSFIHYLLIIY